MKSKCRAVFVTAFSVLVGCSSLLAQTQRDTIQVVTVDSVQSKKEEKNRNPMLNADNNSGPRSVNIGLPFQGDLIILENDVPVVYTFWPTIPTATWRYDNSLAKMGLLSFAEGALTFGKVGYAVMSSDRDMSSSFKGFGSIYTNSFGSHRYDATFTGPIDKSGWGFTLSMFEAFDRGNGINYMYTPWNDRTQMFKAGITKKYKNGSVRVLYKHSDSKIQLTNYYPLVYEGNGKTHPLDGFRLGRDTYIVRDGNIPNFDALTGQAQYINLNDNNSTQHSSNTFYLIGENKFTNGWKLNYTSMFQDMKSPFSVQFPVSLLIKDPDQQAGTKFYYQGTNKPYAGSVQYVTSQLIPKSDNRTIISRAEITKKINQHDLRFGLTQQFNHQELQLNSGLYLQTIEPNPQRVDMYAVVPGVGEFKATNDFGLLPAAAGGYGYTLNTKSNQLALYGSDDFNVTKWLQLGVGARLEHQNIHEIKNPYINDFANGREFIEHDFKNLWNKVGVASAVAKVTKSFGFVGDLTYNEWNTNYWDYGFRDDNGNPIADPSTPGAKPLQTTPKTFKTKVMNFGGGIFINHKNFSVVSKLTRITKENIRVSLGITNPANAAQRSTFDPLFYDISTLGWSTDVVATPFKNFSIHYLLTLQNPQYKNYSYGAYGVNYTYTNNTIPELSKTLMEIDPSYSMLKGAMRVWVSLRYFGKQYANPTNAFYYHSWWENFGGIDYRASRNIQLKLQVTNFLNQEGVKGAVQGADQILDASPYVGRKVVAGAIRPRTIELTATFKF